MTRKLNARIGRAQKKLDRLLSMDRSLLTDEEKRLHERDWTHQSFLLVGLTREREKQARLQKSHGSYVTPAPLPRLFKA